MIIGLGFISLFIVVILGTFILAEAGVWPLIVFIPFLVLIGIAVFGLAFTAIGISKKLWKGTERMK